MSKNTARILTVEQAENIRDLIIDICANAGVAKNEKEAILDFLGQAMALIDLWNQDRKK